VQAALALKEALVREWGSLSVQQVGGCMRIIVALTIAYQQQHMAAPDVLWVSTSTVLLSIRLSFQNITE
jgi:hypothetical protein